MLFGIVIACRRLRVKLMRLLSPTYRQPLITSARKRDYHGMEAWMFNRRHKTKLRYLTHKGCTNALYLKYRSNRVQYANRENSLKHLG